jgi:hypothetical protein
MVIFWLSSQVALRSNSLFARFFIRRESASLLIPLVSVPVIYLYAPTYSRYIPTPRYLRVVYREALDHGDSLPVVTGGSDRLPTSRKRNIKLYKVVSTVMYLPSASS